MPRRLSSSCRQFRQLHVEYVDGLLPDEVHSTCRAHLDACPVCAAHDVKIRRSLLTLQALPTIEVSAGFHARLCERLSEEARHYAPARRAWIRRAFGSAIIAAAAVLSVVVTRGRTAEPLRLTPVVARTPEMPPSSIPMTVSAPTLRTTVATGRSPRFEALPGRAAKNLILQAPHVQSVRLQAVNYLGQ